MATGMGPGWEPFEDPPAPACVPAPEPAAPPEAAPEPAAAPEPDPAPPPRIPTRSLSNPAGPPRRRRNTLSDLPATSPPSSGVTANLAREGTLGRVSPCSKTWHSYPVSFNPNQLFPVEYSDTLLEGKRQSRRIGGGCFRVPVTHRSHPQTRSNQLRVDTDSTMQCWVMIVRNGSSRERTC